MDKLLQNQNLYVFHAVDKYYRINYHATLMKKYIQSYHVGWLSLSSKGLLIRTKCIPETSFRITKINPTNFKLLVKKFLWLGFRPSRKVIVDFSVDRSTFQKNPKHPYIKHKLYCNFISRRWLCFTNTNLWTNFFLAKLCCINRLYIHPLGIIWCCVWIKNSMYLWAVWWGNFETRAVALVL